CTVMTQKGENTPVMHFPRLRAYSHWWRNSILVVMLLFCVSCSLRTQTNASQKSTSASVKPPLPGQEIWKDGVSSFLFGTNDTQEWLDNNVETNAGIQQALKDAHFTLMRTFFFDKSL